MKKRTILAFGLLAGILLLAGGSFQGEAASVTVILQDNGHCPSTQSGNTCWVNPLYEEEDCNECCNRGTAFYVDRYGCDCCCPPGGGDM